MSVLHSSKKEMDNYILLSFASGLLARFRRTSSKSNKIKSILFAWNKFSGMGKKASHLVLSLCYSDTSFLSVRHLTKKNLKRWGLGWGREVKFKLLCYILKTTTTTKLLITTLYLSHLRNQYWYITVN